MNLQYEPLKASVVGISIRNAVGMLVRTQRQCEISKDIVDNYRAMFESRISAERTEKLPCSENLRISSVL